MSEIKEQLRKHLETYRTTRATGRTTRMVLRAMIKAAHGGTALLVFATRDHADQVRQEYDLPETVAVTHVGAEMRGRVFDYVEMDHYAEAQIVRTALEALTAYDRCVAPGANRV